MKAMPHRFLALVIAVALAAVFWWRPTPSDVLSPTTVSASAEWPDFLARILVRDQLARDAAAGRRSLTEVAVLFRELNKQPPETALADSPDANGPALRIPLDTEEARLCRQVVMYAHAALRDEAPGRAAEAVARLEAEFFEELRQHGIIRLPDPSSLESVEKLLNRARASLPE